MKIIFLLIIAMFANSDQQLETSHISVEKGGLKNPNLSFIHAPEGWTGNKLNNKNQFQNIDSVDMLSFRDVLRWKLKKNPYKQEKKLEKNTIQVVKDTTFLNSDKDVIVWLGHSTFFIRTGGVTFMTDPVFYDITLVKRQLKMPFDPAFIKKLDYIIISHNHRDHCDKKSLKLLSENNPKAKILAGLGMEKLLKQWVKNNIQEAGWFQMYQLTDKIRIVFLPAQHWSKRGLNDTNEQLWGSFSIKAGSKSIYFGGDTGWGSHFAYIGNYFGPFDACLLPIGAYAPRWFMKPSHIDPIESIEAFRLLKGLKFYPMHYGTYDLSDEPMGEPLRVLQKEFNKKFQPTTLVYSAAGKENVL